jgi:hypothetical protein
MGALLLIIIILYLLFGLIIIAITYWPVTLSLLLVAGSVWFYWPQILGLKDRSVIRVHGVVARLKLHGLTRMYNDRDEKPCQRAVSVCGQG